MSYEWKSEGASVWQGAVPEKEYAEDRQGRDDETYFKHRWVVMWLLHSNGSSRMSYWTGDAWIEERISDDIKFGSEEGFRYVETLARLHGAKA